MPLMNFQAASRLSPVTPLGMANAEPVASVRVCVLLRIPGSMVMKLASTSRVRTGNTDVITDAEENVRQKVRAEGVMECLKVINVLARALGVRSRCEVLKASVKALGLGR